KSWQSSFYSLRSLRSLRPLCGALVVERTAELLTLEEEEITEELPTPTEVTFVAAIMKPFSIMRTKMTSKVVHQQSQS
uniref:Uncharacterized protein n=1 Tax=Ciona savignyi TaxID=51511 RepID=H2YFV3_CIOSA